MLHALLLVALASAPAAAPTPAPQGEGQPLVVLHRLGCGAPCPAYTVSIWADGRVEFEGEKRVATKGRLSATLPREQVEALRQAFREAGFSRFKPKYIVASTTDMESVVVTYAPRGRAKKVLHNLGDATAPEALTRLEQRIDALVGTERWVKGGEVE